jgi:hypothetical protein
MSDGLTKRGFLQTLGMVVPSLRLMTGEARRMEPTASAKCTPIDCSSFFTASDSDLKTLMKHPASTAADIAGRRSLRGIPFLLGPPGAEQKRYVVLGKRGSPGTTARLELPVAKTASFVCLAQFCDQDENEEPAPGADVAENLGQRLAELVMVFEDGTEHRHPIRRRFEVTSSSVIWGRLCFAAVPHRKDVPLEPTAPLTNARNWGDHQLGVQDSNYAGQIVWLTAIPNPFPDRPLKQLRLEAADENPLAVCGVTLFHGRENPLRYDRLRLYRITLPEPSEQKRWEVAADLGVVARTYQLAEFDAAGLLASRVVGLGEEDTLGQGAKYLYAEVSASPEATLTLRDLEKARVYEFDLGGEGEARTHGTRIEFLEREKTWQHVRVIDAATGRPTPVRISIRSRDGRYIPPYGHRTEVSTGWFQSYGADVKVQDTSFAYVDGTFQVELPVGEVYVELTKGFEYEPVRRKLEIRPDRRELDLEISRFADFRSQGWVSADSHVHFLSPSTAILEGQAEGLNLINLLAAQWGDLFTNVGDLSHGAISSRDGEMIVQVGTENRNHILGHLGLLGGNGFPVFPLSTSGPEESYIGDPLWNSMSDWADRCRAREGLVMAVHFPHPVGELAADIVLGKIDAVEIRPDAPGEHFNNLPFLDWYRYLNCGYRLPVFGGTDKMSAFVPAGSLRGYAWIGKEEFTFANWAAAVRKGNTFMTSGPLLLFEADGRVPGGEITLGSGGGTIEVRATAKSAIPIHRLEVVFNGKVVASREEAAGAREMTLKESVSVSGPGWLAARCASRVPNPERRIAAHSSAVYVVVPGTDLFSAPAAAYLLTLIEGTETWARNLAVRPDADRLARVLEVFTRARARLHERLHQHGIPH